MTGGRAREDATEGNPNRGVVFTISLKNNAVSGRDVSVDYATEVTGDDNATSGLDFTATSGRLVILAGQKSGTVTVPVLNDTLDEPDETFTLRLSGEDHATLETADSTATGTITDDNDAATDLLVENVRGGEGAGTIVFQVRLAIASGQEVTVDYETVSGTATEGTDCNADGADFAETSGTLTFPVGDKVPTEPDPAVTICDDLLDEHDETFGLQLRNPSNATAPRDPATDIIEDNDPEPDLSVDDPRVVEGAGNIKFTVTLKQAGGNADQASGKEVTVNYATADGTAEAGEDYTAKTGPLTFDAGETSQTVEVRVSNDQISEDDETFTLVLSDPDNATANVDSGTATIVDNDGEPGLRVNDIQVRENAGTVRFTVTLEPVSSGTVTVDYATMDGTATEPDDYTATNGTLTFVAGDSTETVDVDIISDSTAEEDETFTLVLSSPNPTDVDLDDATGEATITERSTTPRRTTPRPTTPGGGSDDVQTSTTPVGAPAIGLFLSDQVLQVGTPPVVVDVSVGFVGVVDSYRAVAGNGGIVGVSVSGSQVSLTGLTVGVTTVSVTTKNSSGMALQSFRVTVTDGNAPGVRSFLPDRVLTVGNPPVVVELSSAFEGAVDYYTATAGDPRLILVVVSGSRVSLTGLEVGVTTVNVAATNPNGMAFQSFRVTVRQPGTPGSLAQPGPRQEIPTH